MYVWIVCTRKSSYCNVYATKTLAVAWMLHGMPANYDWRMDYRLIETEVCEGPPEDYIKSNETFGWEIT